MRNKLLLPVILLPILLGCGIADRVKKAASESNSNAVANVNANKTLTDQAVDTAVGEKKIGIVECDEAMDLLSVEASDPDDNFVTKAVKKTALNTFREQLKKSIEENKNDKKEVAKFCRDFRDNLQKPANENSNGAKVSGF